MSALFRVALSGDFRKADGSPVFPDFDLAPLKQAPGSMCRSRSRRIRTTQS
jgi:D-3-phosphoglycerate dehydrogenase